MTEITQADKNRADQWLDRPSDTPARKSERDRLAHKFARHREQAEQETVAKIVAWLRDEAPAALHDPRMVGDVIEAKWGKK